MSDLARRAVMGLLRFQALLAALLFVPALSLTWWQGWLFWLVISAANLVITLYFLRHDPALIERRIRAGPQAERRPVQKRILSLAGIAAGGLCVVPAIDHALGWSLDGLEPTIAGEVLVLSGYGIIFQVFRENAFASSVVEVGAGQRVIATGPYAVVRHPMYAGAIVSLIGTPLALGSLRGLVPAIILVGLIVWRLTDEEAFLIDNLPGYAEYRQRVRRRLVPGIW